MGYHLKPKKMSDKILIDHLGDLVTNVNLRWKLHKDLFQGHEQYQIFNKAGPAVWILLRESLFDSIMMDLGRLMDPGISCGRKNLSFEHVVKAIPRIRHDDVINKLLSLSRENFGVLVTPWRNRRLGHNDLETIIDNLPLPDIHFSEIDSFINKINNLARTIGLAVCNIDQSFVPYLSLNQWSLQLFRILRAGINADAAVPARSALMPD
jgi:hypothetical protein